MFSGGHKKAPSRDALRPGAVGGYWVSLALKGEKRGLSPFFVVCPPFSSRQTKTPGRDALRLGAVGV